MFQDREEAARRLAQRLSHYRGEHPLILAIPRGGVPMGRIVADELGGELDVALVHKVGAPGNPEYAVGAVDETGHLSLNEAAHALAIPRSYLDREVQAQLDRLRRRRELYGRPRARPEGRDVILVDDGTATGATLMAAIGAVRAMHPRRLVVAVGVAPAETAERLRKAADELICLETPPFFYAVGQFFADFSQVSDEEVVALLGKG